MKVILPNQLLNTFCDVKMRIKVNILASTETDPGRKDKQGDFGNIWKSSLITGHYCSVGEMKHTSQHCCDKTMDDKMALYRECCFPNCTKL